MGTKQRLSIFVAVTAVHVAGIVWLLMVPHVGTSSPQARAPVELLSIAPTLTVKVRTQLSQPQQLSVQRIVPETPLTLDTAPFADSSIGQGDSGAGINWNAEARRAVAAFEIRRDEPTKSSIVSPSPWEGWWPAHRHRSGQRFKTPNGDWIVWVSANCYKIASWHAATQLSAADESQIICADVPSSDTD